MANCTHRDQVKDVAPLSDGCEECRKAGESWVALRVCETCGHVGCCDSTRGMHARQHFKQTGHPIIRPLTGKKWEWCYVDDTYVS